jgi:multisubunit Na+/H+ antiporter MnhE subunit
MVLLIGAGTLFWIVVSGDASLRGVLLGCAFSVFAGRLLGLNPEAGHILRFALRLLRTLPQAFREGIELMTGRFSARRFAPQKAPPSPWSVFEEVYLVTLTPRTLVVHVDRLRTMLVHCLDEEKRG